jgi:hypothetical protein
MAITITSIMRATGMTTIIMATITIMTMTIIMITSTLTTGFPITTSHTGSNAMRDAQPNVHPFS